MSYTAGQVLRVEEKALTVDMDMIIVLKKYPSIAITGNMTTYTAPEVVVQYHAIACSSGGGGGGAPTFTPTGNVTFLLAKGNVTAAEVTAQLRTDIQTAIATALNIVDIARVFIDDPKASPRRDKEVNMVVHVEHDDSASGNDAADTIASKTSEVATAVKTTLNTGGLNVCGCNAASLVDQQVQTSITC